MAVLYRDIFRLAMGQRGSRLQVVYYYLRVTIQHMPDDWISTLFSKWGAERVEWLHFGYLNCNDDLTGIEMHVTG